MKISIGVLACVLLASGCDGGGGDGTLYGLTPGDYLTSSAVLVQDGCNIGLDPLDLNGNILTVTTSDGIVTVDGEDYTRSGNSFSLTQFSPGQQISPGCAIDAAIAQTGSIVAPDSFAMSLRIDASNPVGTSCASDLPATLPCTTQLSFQADLQ